MERVERYEVPEWAKSLAVKPTSKTSFSLKHTPIHRWNLPDVPAQFQVSIKREDLTGSVCSGNKIRKLDFCLGEAIDQNCDCVVTYGGVGSNHARATAFAARQLGLESHLFLVTKSEKITDVPCTANYLLHRLSGANIYLLPPGAVELKLSQATDIVEDFSKTLRSQGHNPYAIPAGGFSAIGSWGYIDAWQEFMQQGVLENFDDIVLAAGSSGCVFGLALANYLTGSKLKVHGVTVGQSVENIYEAIQNHLQEFGMDIESRELVNIIGGYIGEGYGKSTKDELEFIVKVMSSTGISLDPDFTVKAVRGMLSEMKERPEIFKGNRILFVHTGGIFGLFDGRIEDVVAKATSNKVKLATEVLPQLLDSRLIKSDSYIN